MHQIKNLLRLNTSAKKNNTQSLKSAIKVSLQRHMLMSYYCTAALKQPTTESIVYK